MSLLRLLVRNYLVEVYWNFEILVFEEKGKLEYPLKKTSWKRVENQQ